MGNETLQLDAKNPYAKEPWFRQVMDQRNKNSQPKQKDSTDAVKIPLKDILKYNQEREARERQAAKCAIEVIQIPVLQQSCSKPWPRGEIVAGLPWQRVAQGEGGHCGYHALKNVELLMGILGGPRFLTRADDALIQSLNEFPSYQDFMQRNTQIIDQIYRQGTDLSWLGGGELEYLRNQIPATYRNNILIVEQVRVQGFEFHRDILKAVQQFAQQQNAILGMVWNAGNRQDLRSMGGSHWVGYVAVKISERNSCKIQLYVMDSGSGGGQMYLRDIQELFSMSAFDIENRFVAEQVQHMEQDLDMLSNPLRRNPASLQDIVELIVDNWKDYAQLPQNIQLEIMDWMERTWDSATNEQKFFALEIYKNVLIAKLNHVQERLQALFARR